MSIYNISQSFEENIENGPYWDNSLPKINPPKKKYLFMGHKVNTLFGVSASPLTHGSKAVSLMSKLGYDIITYRSVRSRFWKGQTYPHWRYVNIPKQLKYEDLANPVLGNEQPFTGQDISTANSFGIQSSKPSDWQKEFEIAQKSILPGQLLILSIMFTPEENGNIIEDIKLVAGFAKETSAKVFEINLAHPNSGMKSLVYEDVQTSVSLCKSVRNIIKDRPLIAKVGYYKDKNILQAFLKQSQGIVQGISSTNTYAMPVVNKEGSEVFPGRLKAGVSGSAIRSLSLEQAKTILYFKQKHHLSDMNVIGIGGVMKAEHIDEYLNIGVDAVQSAVGVWNDPYLAQKYKEKHYAHA
jgi:dihydroorotate dehydrogenase